MDGIIKQMWNMYIIILHVFVFKLVAQLFSLVLVMYLHTIGALHFHTCSYVHSTF